MKKFIAILLAATLALSLAACTTTSKDPIPSTVPTSPSTSPSTAPTTTAYSGSLVELIQAIYDKQPVDLMLSEPTAIDVADPDALSYYFGLEDGSKLSEAIYSEALITSQAYSLCAARVADAKDAGEVAQEILEKVNPNKWICVTAENVQIGVSGDLILLVMVSDSLSETLADDLMAAFTEVVGGSLDTTLKK